MKKRPSGRFFSSLADGEGFARSAYYAGYAQTVTISLRFTCEIYLFSTPVPRVLYPTPAQK